MRSAHIPSPEEITRRYLPRVYRFCRGLLRDEDEAKEACQETFLAITRRAGDLPGVRRLTPWVLKIALLACLHARRRRRQGVPIEPEAGVDDVGAEDPPLDRHEDAERVRRAMERLPDRYRAILALRFQQDLTTEEAADVLGISEGAARVLLHRAVLKLRREVRGS
ncbi:MAG: RNA polymerase sigma factor [Planctomycetota bacterium]